MLGILLIALVLGLLVFSSLAVLDTDLQTKTNQASVVAETLMAYHAAAIETCDAGGCTVGNDIDPSADLPPAIAGSGLINSGAIISVRIAGAVVTYVDMGASNNLQATAGKIAAALIAALPENTGVGRFDSTTSEAVGRDASAGFALPNPVGAHTIDNNAPIIASNYP